MKKAILLFLMLLISLLLPAVSDASYIIHLKNGGRFLTPQYWEEDNYVNFYIVGGMMGIEKDSVRKIERSTLDLSGMYEVKKPEKGPAQVEPKPPALPVSEKGNREENRFMKEFNLIKERFQTVTTMTTEELSAFEKELTAFRNKILAERLGHVYVDQLLELANMGDKLEDILKARGQ